MVWVDATGKTRMTIIETAVTNGSAIQAILQGVSNSQCNLEWHGTKNLAFGVPTPAQYENVQDSADLLYASSVDGSITRLCLPAPHANIFLADQETVDPTAIAVVLGIVTGDLLTGTGQTVDTYLGGTRRRKTIDY